jgi:hypothetical protein
MHWLLQYEIMCVKVVVWANNYLRHIWYLIFTYMCLWFTFCCLLSPVEAFLASSDEHDFIIFRSSWNFLSSMSTYSIFICCLNIRFLLKSLENLKLLVYSTLSLIFPCSWRAVQSIFHIGIRHYSETWTIENSRKNERL